MDRKTRRQKRLRALIDAEVGTIAALAERIDANPTHISQALGSRGISNDLAERVESAYLKPSGWLDQFETYEVREQTEQAYAAELDLAKRHQQLLDAYRSLDSDVRSPIRLLIQALAIKNQPRYQEYEKERQREIKKRKKKAASK